MTADNAPVYAVWKYCVHTNVSTEPILKNQSPVSKSKCTCNSWKSCPAPRSAVGECPLSAGALETIQGISSTVIENLLLFVFFSWVTSDNLYFSMNVCILSKRLPMFAYGCSHYPFKSLSVFAHTRMSFAFPISFTHGFSLFFIHPASQGFSTLTCWVRRLFALGVVPCTVGWLVASPARTQYMPVATPTPGCISNYILSAHFAKWPLRRKIWEGVGASKTALSGKPLT